MKRILITGAGSYIGTAVEKRLKASNKEAGREAYRADTLDLKNCSLDEASFAGYDVVFHVAGIAHQKETKENVHLYYEVNETLAVNTAGKAKKEGVGQFILLSSMSVYGMETGLITKADRPGPRTHYGKSKYNADVKISRLESSGFKTAVLRPPMVYGRGCRGNYQHLRKFALKSPVFPEYGNKRSMVYIENLVEFVKRVIDEEMSGVFFPQDGDYIDVSQMVKQIADRNGRKIRLVKCFNPFITIGLRADIGILKKVFGDLQYEKTDAVQGKTFLQIMKEVEGGP